LIIFIYKPHVSTVNTHVAWLYRLTVSIEP